MDARSPESSTKPWLQPLSTLLVSLLPLLGLLVLANDNAVVSLVRLECQLLLRLDALSPQLLYLLGENGFGGGCAVDTVGLDGDADTAADLEEHVGVQGNDTGLIRLGNVGEDAVDHGDEHAVAQRVARILDDGDDVGAVLGHVDEIATRPVGELNGVDVSGRADNVGNVGDGGTRGSTKVQDLGARAHVDVVDTTDDTGGKLASERVPDSVLDLGRHGRAVLALGDVVDGHALLAVDLETGSHALGEQVVLLASGDEDTSVPVRLNNNLGTAARAARLAAATRTSTTAAAAIAKASTAATATIAKATTATASATTITESSATTAATTATATVTTAKAATAAASASGSEAHCVSM